MEWEIAYQVYLDGEPVTYPNITSQNGIATMEIVGTSKKDAYDNQFADQWQLIFPGVDLPARRRIKLQEVDRVRWG